MTLAVRRADAGELGQLARGVEAGDLVVAGGSTTSRARANARTF